MNNNNIFKTAMVLGSLAVGLGVNPVKHPLLWPIIEINDVRRVLKAYDYDYNETDNN